ncbi:MAG: hypothetical protein JW751_25095 [Polyangiaceae bacterium]|nr:hypothetical protein [Polyangiaceae bacterium]
MNNPRPPHADSSDRAPWEHEVLAWLARLVGGTVERGDRVRALRGQTVAEAFVSLCHRVHGERVPTEVRVHLRTRVETAPGSASAESEQEPYRGASSARHRVRGRPRIALGAAPFIDSSLEHVNPTRSLQAGDPRLDGVRFASDSSDAEIAEVLGAADLQSWIADPFERRCDWVSINEGGEWLFACFRLQPQTAEEGERARGIVDALVALSNALPLFLGPAREPSRLSGLVRAFPVLMPVIGILLTVIGTTWRLPLDELPPVACAGVGFALWALYLVGPWLFLRRLHPSHAILMFVGLPTFCVGLGLLINGSNSGPLERHSVEVLSKRWRRGHHYLDVKDFRPGESGLLRVEARSDLWERTEPGQVVVLMVGPGRLGWPWLARIEAPPR